MKSYWNQNTNYVFIYIYFCEFYLFFDRIDKAEYKGSEVKIITRKWEGLKLWGGGEAHWDLM